MSPQARRLSMILFAFHLELAAATLSIVTTLVVFSFLLGTSIIASAVSLPIGFLFYFLVLQGYTMKIAGRLLPATSH